MAYYVRVDGEIVLVATRKADVDDWVKSVTSDNKKNGIVQKITVDTK